MVYDLLYLIDYKYSYNHNTKITQGKHLYLTQNIFLNYTSTMSALCISILLGVAII